MRRGVLAAIKNKGSQAKKRSRKRPHINASGQRIRKHQQR